MNIKNIVLLAVGVKLAGACSVVLALEGDVIRPYASATYSYDNNLRRFSSKEQALLSTGRKDTSDRVLITGVGIVLDKQVSQQHFYADVGVNRSKYDNNSELNNDGKEITVRWDWSVGNRWDGKLEAYHKEAMVPFADYRGFAMNIRTQDRRAFEAQWLFHPRWKLRANVMNAQTEYSASQRAANLEENSQEVGIDYLSPSKSKIGVLYRHVRGVKPLQTFFGVPISNDYDQNELKLNVDWAVTGKSKLQFLGGIVDRQHDEISARDFRRFNARGNYAWLPTGKTAVSLSMWKENNAQAFVTTSYTVNTGASVTGTLNMTGKVSLQANAQYVKRDFQGDVIFGQEREDKNKNYSLAVIYKPTLSLMLNASYSHNSRESTSQQLSFDSNGLALTGQYEF